MTPPKGLIVFSFTERFEEMRRFYEAALGVPGRGGGPNWVEFDLGPSKFALHRQVTDRPQPLTESPLDVRVDDIEAATQRFVGAGAAVVRGIQDEAFGKSAVVRDLEGRITPLVQEDSH